MSDSTFGIYGRRRQQFGQLPKLWNAIGNVAVRRSYRDGHPGRLTVVESTVGSLSVGFSWSMASAELEQDIKEMVGAAIRQSDQSKSDWEFKLDIPLTGGC